MQTVALHQWLLIPGVFVIVGVLAFNFVGDGLRDAADPTSNPQNKTAGSGRAGRRFSAASGQLK